MKRTVFFIIAVWVAAGLAFGQSVVVQSPKAGDIWYKGQEYTITWTKAGCDNPDVKINIFKNSIDQANFVLQLTGPNSGSMKWTVPGSFTTGKYVLRIKAPAAPCLGDSGDFTVAEKISLIPKVIKLSEKPIIYDFLNKIQITEPVAGSQHKVGLPIVVKWSKDFGNYNFVNISFFHIDGVKIAGFAVHNTGTYSSWTPKSLYNNKEIYVEIRTEDGKFKGRSGNFRLIQVEEIPK